jgi:tRNA threonylcarbamoyladenosine dehydratase
MKEATTLALHRFSREELLIGEAGLKVLREATVAVFGIGGVGSFTVEGLARAGVGKLILVDYDDICLTNINRQLHALQSTIGKQKVDLMAERVKEINPKCEVVIHREFYTPQNSDKLLNNEYSYVVDAIDNMTGKIDLVKKCAEIDIPIVSAMGAGNKLDPTAFQVADIYKTSMDPLAKIMRKELRKVGIKKLKVVYSTEKPVTPKDTAADCKTNCVCTNKDFVANCTLRRQIPGSISFVPSVMGLILAGVVVNDLLKTANIDV